MSTNQQLYESYKNKLQQIADVNYAAAVLQWDQETYLPVKGNDARGRQLATLTTIAHQMFTDTSTEDLINVLILKKDITDQQRKNIELSAYDLHKSKKLPSAFVRKSTEIINKSFHAWIAARKANDFSIFENPLQEVIDIKKQEADLLGYDDHPYDALMKEYDNGLTVKETDRIFDELRPAITEILYNISQCPQPDNSFLHGHFDKTKQWDLGLYLLKAMHFDFEAGRQDISEHPFTTNFCSKDVRITTRIDENDLANMVWSCIHEGGHALYEQGLPEIEYGLPLGTYCSLSIHESQSRIWENCIGRSLEFWQHHYPKLQSYFPEQLKAIDIEKFYFGINKVQPSLIRTEADELTYHFHVMIRYEIEKQLIEGSLTAKDIPNVWNEMYQKMLHVTVPNDKLGCLQDVHWSHGSFGYFPTYSIGSLYASQFWSAINDSSPDIKKEISFGNNMPVLNWLQNNIFSFGRYYLSNQLCKRATGEILNPNYFIQYAKDKFYDIYKN